MEGLLLVHKPPGMTSHDVVDVVRRRLGTRRIGHTGTLDPMAEGLLILLVGPATKQQQAFQGHDKVYEAAVRLGSRTDTGDAAGTVVHEAPVPALTREGVSELLRSFNGTQVQTPPAYSAVKVRGRPAYWWARRHAPVVLSPRTIHLSEMTLVELQPDTITFRVHCSAGTYVRTVAEAIAQRLGTDGHVVRLIRLRVGAWDVADARPLAWFRNAAVEEIVGSLTPCAS